MSESWTVELLLEERDDQPILIYVYHKTGGHELDLDLLATDGESAYQTKVRERKLDKLRNVNYSGHRNDLSAALQYILISKARTALPETLPKESLRINCKRAVGGIASLSITLLRDVAGIHDKLGTLEIPRTENTDHVDLFRWASQLVRRRDDLDQEVKQSKDHVEKAEETIRSLQTQLQDLIRVKEENETQLLSKFTLLLNEKKLHIRTLQQQLAEQHVPVKSVATAKASKSTRKRKDPPTQTDTRSDSESDAFEAMDVDRASHSQSEQEMEDAKTTSGESETDDESEAVPLARTASTEQSTKVGKPSATPPPRELPFSKNTTTSAAKSLGKQVSNASDADEGDETASEDDEL